MQTPNLISLIVNIVLGITLLSYVLGPKVYKYITKYMKDRETRRVTRRDEEIRKVVIDFLKEIQKDG